MKPVAPDLKAGDAADQPTLQSEIDRLCDAKAREEDATAGEDRITIPSPPSEETLRAATPYPPAPSDAPPDVAYADDEMELAQPRHVDTTPAPPPLSAIRPRGDSAPDTEPDAEAPSTIPGPPRVPRIAGM